jgi:hypothetical protein
VIVLEPDKAFDIEDMARLAESSLATEAVA